MINIIDTYRNVTGDKFAYVKIIIMTIPVLICVYMQMFGQAILSTTANIIFGVVFLAIFLETIRRSCNSEPMLLPPFLMPIRMFFTLGFSILAAIPVGAICLVLLKVIVDFFVAHPELTETPLVAYVFYFIAGLLLTSLFFASLTQYLDTGKIYDAYNPKKIMFGLKTFIVNFAFYFVQAALLNTFVGVMPALVIYAFAGNNPSNFFFVFFICMVSVINYLMLADYIGQTKKESEIW